MPETSDQLFALFFIDESGVEWFAGGFKKREDAQAKAERTGKKYSIKEVPLSDF